ncbi:MAG: hypothetical protein GY792_01100 [Gammaproteobacteria bacterium]|nr:hypothetical protein [Gammaproteobacteria bacterium]
MSARLPEIVDPWRLAERNKVIAGELELASLPRITDALMDSGGIVRFEFNFSRDAKNRTRITGFVRAGLGLECQRCLETMVLAVDSQLDLVVIEVPAEADRIPEECEPFLVEDGGLRVADLIEEELLLAIPLVPMHEREACSMKDANTNDSGRTDDLEKTERVNPFAVLSVLKTDNEN